MPSENNTFPLNRARIRREKWKRALSSPVSWAPFLPAVGAFTFLEMPAWGFGASLVAIGVGLTAYWRKEGAVIEAKLIREMIAESNSAQDRELAAAVLSFEQSGHQISSDKMLAVLRRKYLIEEELHRDGELTPQVEEVEKLVDTLAFGVRDQLQRLIKMEADLTRPIYQADNQARADHIARIEEGRRQVNRAAETIDETFNNLHAMLDPAGDTSDLGTHPELDRVIERLQEESSIARKVRDRMRSTGRVSDHTETEETPYAADSSVRQMESD